VDSGSSLRVVTFGMQQFRLHFTICPGDNGDEEIINYGITNRLDGHTPPFRT